MHSNISIKSEEREKERKQEMCVISINGAEEEDKRGERQKVGVDGLLDYQGYECQRAWKSKSYIKYAALQN